MEEHKNRQVVLAQYPVGLPDVEKDFKIDHTPVPALQEVSQLCTFV